MRFTLLAILMCLAACAEAPTDTAPHTVVEVDGWSESGLRSVAVHTLVESGSYTVAGTDHGAFRRTTTSTDTAWKSAGLSNVDIGQLDSDATGHIWATSNERDPGNESRLFSSSNNGTTWKEHRLPTGETQPPLHSVKILGRDTILVGGAAVIVRSVDGGGTWTIVMGDWNLGGVGIHVIHENTSGTLLAAGESGFFQPVMFESTDRGTTWRRIITLTNGDNAHYSIETSPSCILTGMELSIIESCNGGVSWNTRLIDAARYFYSIVRVRDVLVASGPLPHDENPVVAVYTSRFSTAEWVKHASPMHANVFTMKTKSGLGPEVLIGTSDGVKRYRIPE